MTKNNIFTNKQKKVLYYLLLTFCYFFIGWIVYTCLKIIIPFLNTIRTIMPEMSTTHLYWTIIVMLFLIVYVCDFGTRVLFKNIKTLHNKVNELKKTSDKNTEHSRCPTCGM